MAPPNCSLPMMAAVLVIVLIFMPSPAAAFGAGNIPSIAQIEGKNWRHGDIEDMLKTVAFLSGHKWTTMQIKRVYFGNWLRDYSQAVDVGSLKGVSAPTIRILVWVLSFLSFGYATEEFEVTEERLGVYRPEEHIDNPKGYADGLDARKFDKRLRGPINPAELEIDRNSGMKNYIANERGDWATSSGYIKYSFSRSIHFGRLYTNGAGNSRGREADLFEALRCLGQGLHCLEDFGAHTNYCELALRELGFADVFPHTGVSTQINIRGKHVYPLVTGTFGAVDFLHSVLGEATDHFTQTEVDEMEMVLKTAETRSKDGQLGGSGGGDRDRGLFGPSSSDGGFVDLLGQIPGLGGDLMQQAQSLQAEAQQQEYMNSRDVPTQEFQAPPGSYGGPPGPGIPGLSASFDPEKVARQIYPILEFRDKIVKAINSTIAKIPGLEALVERISETLTLFILSLLAPFVRPIINAVSESLKKGSSAVVDASANSQFEPWNDDHSTDPTHSMLSKDHFSNFLNPCAGRVASTILQYAAPRVIFAWQHPGVPVEEVMNDIIRVFHHPAIRDERVEIQRDMFNTVRRWVDEQRDRNRIDEVLSSSSVKAGRNHSGDAGPGGGNHDHGGMPGGLGDMFGGHSKNADSLWSEIKSRDLGEMSEGSGRPFTSSASGFSSPFQPTKTPEYGYSSAWRPPTQSATSSSLNAYVGRGKSQSYYSGQSYEGGAPAASYENFRPSHQEYSGPTATPYPESIPSHLQPSQHSRPPQEHYERRQDFGVPTGGEWPAMAGPEFYGGDGGKKKAKKPKKPKKHSDDESESSADSDLAYSDKGSGGSDYEYRKQKKSHKKKHKHQRSNSGSPNRRDDGYGSRPSSNYGSGRYGGAEQAYNSDGRGSSQGGGYPGQRQYGEQRLQNEQPPYGGLRPPPPGEESPYGAQTPYGGPNNYPSQPGGYGGQPPYEQPSYGAQIPYSEQRPYEGQPPYGGQQPYGNQPQYAEQPPYGGQMPYGGQPSYGEQQPPYGAQQQQQPPYGQYPPQGGWGGGGWGN